MFALWFDTPERRIRDQERVLAMLWQAGHSRLDRRLIARKLRVSEKRVGQALSVLEARRLVSRLERTGQYALTMEGHRVA